MDSMEKVSEGGDSAMPAAPGDNAEANPLDVFAIDGDPC
jgi:hypothetical protein